MSQGSLEQRVNTTGLDHSKALYSATFFNLILSDQKRKVVKLLSKLNHIKEEPEIKFANICWVIEKAREFQKNIYFCFTDYAKAFTVWITINCGKFWKRWKYQTTWPASRETCMQVRKQQLELDMEQQIGSK